MTTQDEQPICVRCGVIHRGIPDAHRLAPAQVRRATSFSRYAQARNELNRELLRRRRNQRRP